MAEREGAEPRIVHGVVRITQQDIVNRVLRRDVELHLHRQRAVDRELVRFLHAVHDPVVVDKINGKARLRSVERQSIHRAAGGFLLAVERYAFFERLTVYCDLIVLRVADPKRHIHRLERCGHVHGAFERLWIEFAPCDAIIVKVLRVVRGDLFTVERNVLNRAVAQHADAVDLLSAVLIRGGNVDPALAGDIAAQYPLYLLRCFAGQVGELRGLDAGARRAGAAPAGEIGDLHLRALALRLGHERLKVQIRLTVGHGQRIFVYVRLEQRVERECLFIGDRSMEDGQVFEDLLALRLVLVRERERILGRAPPGGDMRDECRVVLRVKRHAEDAAVAGDNLRLAPVDRDGDALFSKIVIARVERHEDELGAVRAGRHLNGEVPLAVFHGERLHQAAGGHACAEDPRLHIDLYGEDLLASVVRRGSDRDGLVAIAIIGDPEKLAHFSGVGRAAFQRQRGFRRVAAKDIFGFNLACHAVGERRADVHMLAACRFRDLPLVVEHAALAGEIDHVPRTRLAALADFDPLEQRLFEEFLMDLIVLAGGEHEAPGFGELSSVRGVGERVGVFAGLERVFPYPPMRYLAVNVRERNSDPRCHRLVQIRGRDEDVYRRDLRFHHAHGAVPVVRCFIAIDIGIFDAQVIDPRLAEENADTSFNVAHVIQRPPFGLVGAAHLDMALSGAVRQRPLRAGYCRADGQAGIVVHHGVQLVYRQVIRVVVRARQDKAEEILTVEFFVVHHDGEILPVRERAKPRDLRRGHSGGLVVIAVPVIHKEIDRPGAAHEA